MKRITKLTGLAMFTTVAGLMTAVNANADTTDQAQVSPTTTAQTVLSASASSTNEVASTSQGMSVAAASAQQSQTSNQVAPQNINIPEGYTLDAVRNIQTQSQANDFQKTAINGMYNNNYQSNSAAAAESVDINALTDSQAMELSQYSLNLVNQIRSEFREAPFIQTEQSFYAVKKMALEYQSKNESLMNGSWHDASILGNSSENISAIQVYVDNISGLASRPMAQALGKDFVNNSAIPLFTISNMDDLQAMVFYGVMAMLFNDASDNYGHAQNFLTNYQLVNQMSTYPSLTSGTGTGTYSDGRTFTFKLENVDMHFIWPEGVKNTSDNSENGWKYENGKHVYYENNKPLSGRNYVELPTINGVGQSWYLIDNGAVQSGVQQWAGTYYYFSPNNYLRVDNAYVQSQWGLWYMFGNDGRIITGLYNWQGSTYYFDPSTYLRVDNSYVATESDGRGVLLGSNGQALTGIQQWMSSYYYFDPVTHLRVDNNYVQSQWGLWYMLGNDGRVVSGLYNWQGTLYYFDPTTYLKVTNQDFWVNGVHYWADKYGRVSRI